MHLNDDFSLLSLMLGDVERQHELYRPGPYWKKYVRRTTKAIRSEGLNEFRSNIAISKGFADVAIDDPIALMSPGIGKAIFSYSRYLPIFSTVAHRFDRLLKKTRREQIRFEGLYYQAVLGDWLEDFSTRYVLPDSLVGNPTILFDFPTMQLADSYLRAYTWIDEYNKCINFDGVKCVCEIGGGFGAMAHSFMHIFPNIKKYVYIDIPPNIYIATQYLKYFYGDCVIDYRATRKNNEIKFSENNELEIMALCPWQMENMSVSIDFFWNSSSFQEMPERVVDNYADKISQNMSAGGRVGCFIYEGGNPRKTIMSETLKTILEGKLSLQFIEIPRDYSRYLLPGYNFLSAT